MPPTPTPMSEKSFVARLHFHAPYGRGMVQHLLRHCVARGCAPVCRMACLLAILTSCGQNEPLLQGDALYATGVGVVEKVAYCQVDFKELPSLCFTRMTEHGLEGMAFAGDSLVCDTVYATGFLVSADGQMATDSEMLADPATSRPRQLADALSRWMQSRLAACQKEADRLQEAYARANEDPDMSYAEFYEVRAQRNTAQSRLEQCKAYARALRKGDFQPRCRSSFRVWLLPLQTGEIQSVPCTWERTDTLQALAVFRLAGEASLQGRHVFRTGDSPVAPDAELTQFCPGPASAKGGDSIAASIRAHKDIRKDADAFVGSDTHTRICAGAPVCDGEGCLRAVYLHTGGNPRIQAVSRLP